MRYLRKVELGKYHSCIITFDNFEVKTYYPYDFYYYEACMLARRKLYKDQLI